MSRRSRLRAAALLCWVVTVSVLPVGSGHAVSARPADPQVDPFVGTAGDPPWFSGHASPAAARPFGLVQLGPDTTDDPAGTPSRWASGYSTEDRFLRGFSATHLSGAGCRILGDVPVLPWTEKLPSEPATATVPLDHVDEDAGPGWYQARLGNGVDVSLTADERAALAVYRFPAAGPSVLLVKGGGSLAGARDVRVTFPDRRSVAVRATSGGFCGSRSTYDVHVLLRFDQRVVDRGRWTGAEPDGDRTDGAWVDFGGTRRLRTQVGVSFVDASGARRNLRDAAPGWAWGSAREEAVEGWQRELDRVRVHGAAEDRRIFDTALYHALLHPTLVSDADGRYPGFDGRVHRVPGSRRHYTAIAGWDAYRTQLPLLAWLRPDVASDVVGSLLRAARQGGWLPKWPLVAAYTGVMAGDSAAPMVASVHAFGGRDFPLAEAVRRLTRQADEVAGRPGQGWFQPRPGLAEYLALGFVPDDLSGDRRSIGASTTLEYAVDDFALSRLASAAGRPRLAARMLDRSGSWVNLLDPERRLLLPRDADGAFPGQGYDPASCCIGFEEGNAVQYTWHVPHDMAGLLARLGDRAEVLDRLTAFHEQLNAGAGRPHAWLGNQPSFATPWAYLWLGAPWLTADVVARARTQLWEASPGGLPGNEDLGSLSAWYVWSSLGLYPLVPGTATVGISVPAFESVTLRPSEGPRTRIVRRGDGTHVRGVRIDGTPHTATWLSAGPGRRPVRIAVRTTDRAQPSWGTAAEDAPPSYSPRR